MDNHLRLLELFWEFDEYIESLHTLYLDSLAGYSLMQERLLEHRSRLESLLGNSEVATDEFQDTCSIMYRTLTSTDFQPASMRPVMKQGAVRRRLEIGGRNESALGRQCVVSAYSYWEEYLRIEIGKTVRVLREGARASESTRKILNKTVTSEFWGDMRHLRNSIVHSQGVANSEIARCKLLTWFKPGEAIDLPRERMHRIFLLMGHSRNALHELSLPKRTFRIPVPRAQ